MNKQELMRRMHEAGVNCKAIKYASQFDKGYNNGIAYAINLLDKLDEPEKPVVPQYVADWYEGHKCTLEWTLRQLGLDMMNGVFDDTEMKGWLNDSKNKPFETIVKMKLFGYEVEKEKLYTVELPNPNILDHLMLQKDRRGKISIAWYCTDSWREDECVRLTESEIKEDFEWAWRFAKEVEE